MLTLDLFRFFQDRFQIFTVLVALIAVHKVDDAKHLLDGFRGLGANAQPVVNAIFFNTDGRRLCPWVIISKNF